MLSKDEISSFSRYVLDKISTEYMRKWDYHIKNNLNQTRKVYQESVEVRNVDDFNREFILTGKDQGRLALMIERGASAFDIKKGFEKSNKKKSKKDGGWYLTVPFRLATGQAIADSGVFAGMGSLPDPIRNIAFKQPNKAITKSQIPERFQIKGKREELNIDKTKIPEYKHKSQIWEGVTYVRKPEERSGTYMKFRRVSDNSDDYSWYHPGFEAHNLMGKALDDINVSLLFDKARDEFLSKVTQ